MSVKCNRCGKVFLLHHGNGCSLCRDDDAAIYASPMPVFSVIDEPTADSRFDSPADPAPFAGGGGDSGGGGASSSWDSSDSSSSSASSSSSDSSSFDSGSSSDV